MINNYMAEHGKDNEPIKDIGKFCFDPYSCAFWQYCTKDLPTPNVFDISGMQKRSKFKQYYGGNISFEDLQHTNINKKYLEQIDFELNNREAKINKKIDTILNWAFVVIFVLAIGFFVAKLLMK